MILLDTSVWIEHLRAGDDEVAKALLDGAVLVHPFVIGEIACGNLRDREQIFALLMGLPGAVVAQPDEVRHYIERFRLFGRGIGYVDVHLLASVALTEQATLWTRDRGLQAVAVDLGCAWPGQAAH